MRKLLCSLALLAAVGALVVAAAPAPAQQKDKKETKKDDKRKDDKKDLKKDASKVEVYQGKDGWRFRVVGPDGKTVAIGVQGFAKKDDCLAAVEALKAALEKAKVTEKAKE